MSVEKINFGSLLNPPAERKPSQSAVQSRSSNTKSAMITNFRASVFQSGKAAEKAKLTAKLTSLAKEDPDKWSLFVRYVFFSAFQAGNGSSLYPKIKEQVEKLERLNPESFTSDALAQLSYEERQSLIGLKIDWNSYVAHKEISKHLDGFQLWAYSTILEVIPNEVWSAMFAQFGSFSDLQKSYVRNQKCYWILLDNQAYMNQCQTHRYLPPWPACGKSLAYYTESDEVKKQAFLVNRLEIGYRLLEHFFPNTTFPGDSWAVRSYSGVLRCLGRQYDNEQIKEGALSNAFKRSAEKYNEGMNAGVEQRKNFFRFSDYKKSGESKSLLSI